MHAYCAEPILCPRLIFPRLIFPRLVKPADKSVIFRLYLGGLNFPEREVEFRVKDLFYQGKLEM